MSAVDLSLPLVAANGSGEVYPARIVVDPNFKRVILINGMRFRFDGSAQLGAGWFIRNSTQPSDQIGQSPEVADVKGLDTIDTLTPPVVGASKTQRDAVMQLAEAAAALNVALDGQGHETKRRAIVEALCAVRESKILIGDVDSDLLLAREIVAETAEKGDWVGLAPWMVREGKHDNSDPMKLTLAAIRRSVILGKMEHNDD